MVSQGGAGLHLSDVASKRERKSGTSSVRFFGDPMLVEAIALTVHDEEVASGAPDLFEPLLGRWAVSAT